MGLSRKRNRLEKMLTSCPYIRNMVYLLVMSCGLTINGGRNQVRFFFLLHWPNDMYHDLYEWSNNYELRGSKLPESNYSCLSFIPCVAVHIPQGMKIPFRNLIASFSSNMCFFFSFYFQPLSLRRFDLDLN